MKKNLIKINAAGAKPFLVIPILALVLNMGGVFYTSQKAAALSGSDFQPGNIISNAVFTNYLSMSVQDIQNFLNSKVPTCDTNGTQLTSHPNGSGGYYTRAQWGQINGNSAPYTCLKDYVENTSNLQNNFHSPGTTVVGGISAAQIIWNAANKYQINPQVIITTLQKEQGLVTDDWPWYNEYQAAMGYGCPDTAACSSKYYGFYNQVDNAAWQFRYYLDHPGAFNYWTGNNYIQYNPDANCGGTVVNIQNSATAALYIYTPYQPNAAALANLSSSSAGGTGDGCSAYGNRNFWWYFTKWFGSTQTTIPYDWNYAGQNAYTDSARTRPYTRGNGVVSVSPGGKAYLQLKARNNGNQTWTQSVTRLGTTGPQDRCSSFNDSSWQSCSRINMVETSVAPGDIATFNFSITAPQTTGTYTEFFSMVADGITWMNGPNASYTIDVVNPTPAAQNAVSTLSSGQSIGVGQQLTSPDTHSVLALQGDGNLVLYVDFKPVWYTGPLKNAGQLIMQGDGNLVLYTKDMKPLWASGTDGHPGAHLALQGDGNIVVYDSSGQPLWASSTDGNPQGFNYINHSIIGSVMYPMQELRTADGKYKLIFQSDGNLVLYSPRRALWASGTDGKPAAIVAMQSDGNLVMYSKDGKPLWYTRTDGNGISKLIMQDDGNLVIYNSSGRATWASGTVWAY